MNDKPKSEDNMNFTPGQTVSITSPTLCSYTFNPAHRGRATRNKSIWTVDCIVEIDCFVSSLINHWMNDNCHWSFHSEQNVALPIGKNIRNDNLFIAKYVDSSNSNNWHGYPVDPRRGGFDRPCTSILHEWVDLGIIDKTQARRIKEGKSCSL